MGSDRIGTRNFPSVTINVRLDHYLGALLETGLYGITNPLDQT